MQKRKQFLNGDHCECRKQIIFYFTGQFAYTFNSPGVFFFDSGSEVHSGRVTLRSVVKVAAAANVAGVLSVRVGNTSAPHNISSGVTRSEPSPSCTPFSGTLPGCSDTPPASPDSRKFVFSFRKCLTPSVSAVSPTRLDGSHTLSISGSGFGSKCQTEVRLGSDLCPVTAASSSQVSCQISGASGPPVGEMLRYSVRLSNAGFARILVPNSAGRFVMLSPHIRSISPLTGSTAGGTRLVIRGGGLNSSPAVSLMGYACVVQVAAYDRIECLTTAAVAAKVSVSVTVKNTAGQPVSALCRQRNNASCEFQYSQVATPEVTAMTPTSIDNTGALTFTGKNLGVNSSDISVTVGNETCNSVTISGDKLTCTAPALPAGTHVVKLLSASRGFAKTPSSPLTLTMNATVTGVSPSEGSTAGGVLITINGRGFDATAAATVVAIGGAPCSVTSVTNTAITCRAPAKPAGSHAVAVTVGGNVAAGTVTFATTNRATPVVISVKPSSGERNVDLTLLGTFPEGSAEVKIGDKQCLVKSKTSNQVSGKTRLGKAGIHLIFYNIGKFERKNRASFGEN